MSYFNNPVKPKSTFLHILIPAVIWTSLFLLWYPAGTWATETGEDDSHTMEPVVVTATRSPVNEQDVAANITVITAKEIEKLPATSVAEVLRFVPGVYVEFNGGLGSRGEARIQGSEFRHVTVYQDGIALNQVLNPVTDLSFLPVEAIERIEVYKGSASSAWGSALGGVINIITKEPQKKEGATGELFGGIGENDTYRARGSISSTHGPVGWLITGTHEESGGFIDHTQYQQNALHAKVNVDVGERSRTSLVAGYNDGHSDDPYPPDPSFWDDQKQRRTYQRLLFETAGSKNLDLTLEARHHQFSSITDDVYTNGREIWSNYEDETWGLGARAVWDASDTQSISAGLDIDWSDYDFYSEVQGSDEEHDIRDWALWANDTIRMGSFTLNAGLRYDDHCVFGGELSPSAGAVYRFSKYNALLRAQIAKGYSAPPPSWVYNEPYGNTELEPEIAINYQVGGEIQPCKYFKAELNLFRADVRDLINFDTEINRWNNIDKVTRQGVEWGISTTIGQHLAISWGGSYVDVENEETGETVDNIPDLTHTIQATYTDQWATHSLLGRWIDHNSTYPETNDRRFVWDYTAKAELPLPGNRIKASLVLTVHDLTDSGYLYRDRWPQPGRWVEVGIRLAF